MLSTRFNALRKRLDALKAGQPPPLGLFSRARAIFGRGEVSMSLEALTQLDLELERAGVHTAADARLLREVGSARGRVSELSRGLMDRAGQSLEQFEGAVGEAERLMALESLEAGVVSQLERDFVRLGRVVKVAAVFSNANDSEPFEIFSRPRVGGTSVAQSPRLAIAEFLTTRAMNNVADSAQKRRDLDLAYELVLRMSADAKVDRDRLRHLRVELGAARERSRSSPAVRSLDDLIRHLRHSAKRDPRTTYKSLRALYDRAIEGGDTELAKVAADAVQSMLPKQNVSALLEKEEAKRLIGWREPAHLEAAEKLAPGGKAGIGDQLNDVLAQVAFNLDEDQQRALELSSGAARFFDVEDSLSEEIVEAELTSTRPIQRRVSHPTQVMTYEFTNSLEDVNNFVVTYPGTVILDLAAGRQMVRSYLEEEPPPKPRRVKKTAVRVYVLDASGSMYGARARFRDAILIAELNAMRVKAKVGLPFDPIYFSYFNDTPSELTRVDSGDDATRHIEALFKDSPAEGQTDISLALMLAFDSIGKAQGRDPYLARATVVLVTDGEDGVDLELIRKTRKPFEGLDIALSFISLGEENTDLKSLVLEQRRDGGRAFYHHLSDPEIQLARTEFDSAFRTLIPSEVPVGPDVLEKLLPHLEALEAIAAGRPVAQQSRSSTQFETLFPPQRPAATVRVPAQVSARLVDVLDAICEAAPLAPVDRRSSEAVDLLLHLVQLYAITLPRYLEAVSDEAVFKSIERVRLLCKPFE